MRLCCWPPGMTTCYFERVRSLSVEVQMSTAPPRFKRLIIEEIFGPGSHTIDVPFRLSERVTVLHGRNGSGKTITLGLIAALRGGQYDKIIRYPFKRLLVDMVDGQRLVIEPFSAGGNERAASKPAKNATRKLTSDHLTYTLSGPKGLHESGSLVGGEAGTEAQARKQELVFREYGFAQVGPDEYRLVGSGETYTKSGLLTMIGPVLERHGIANTDPSEGPLLKAFREALPSVKFVQTDRLYRWVPDTADRYSGRSQMRRQLMVEHLGMQIQALVQRADEQYRKTSTQLDASLAKRLFEPQHGVPSFEALGKRSEALREREERLLRLGLLKESTSTVKESALTEAQRSTFSIILSDREEKLKPFASVVDKAERLLDSLNRKLAPKQVKLDVETGYQILTASGRSLPLSSLSSGEQHELVLLHELLFEVAPGSLILIDEPELSLHVTWQQDMLPDLMKIAELSGVDFLLATHSPFIIGDAPGRADLMVRLGDSP